MPDLTLYRDEIATIIEAVKLLKLREVDLFQVDTSVYKEMERLGRYYDHLISKLIDREAQGLHEARPTHLPTYDDQFRE